MIVLCIKDSPDFAHTKTGVITSEYKNEETLFAIYANGNFHSITREQYEQIKLWIK